MRHVLFPVLALAFAASSVVTARADDDAKVAKALIYKVVKAHGGAEALSKYRGAVLAFKGTFHGMGMEVPMTGEIATQGADRIKVDAEVEAGGQKFKFVSVLAGDKGWIRLGDDTTEMDKDDVVEAAEQAHAGWIVSLIPLVDRKGLTLATTGEQDVGDKKALGVRVSAKGRRDVTLFIDKGTHMLVKYEHRVKDEATGQEVTEENFPTDYKEIRGTKQAMKFVTKRDGKLYVEGTVTDFQLSEKLDEATFAKP